MENVMKEIQLTQGKVTKVDDEDFEFLNRWKWQAQVIGKKCYATRCVKRNCIKTYYYIHREIIGVTDSKVKVDHRDGDGLNNQRYNLRKATHTQNIQNSEKSKNNTTGYKGVFLNKGTNKYFVQMMYQGKYFRSYSYNTPEEAAHVYDEAAKEHHGEFANLNFPEV